MYIAAVIVFFVYFVLLVLSRREKVSERVGVLLRPFYQMAFYLYRRKGIRRFLMNAGVEADLRKLNDGEEKEQVRENYYVRKMALCFAVLLVGTVFGAAVSVKAASELSLKGANAVVRKEFGEANPVLELEAVLEKTEEGVPLTNKAAKQVFKVQVAPREMTEEELSPVIKEFTERLSELILGENESLERVSNDLVLLEAYEGYPFAVEWSSDNPGISGSDGTVFDNYAGEEILLTAKMFYGETEWEEKLSVSLSPPPLSSEEQAYQELETFLINSEKAKRFEKEWKLPLIWQGKAVSWKQANEDHGILMWITAVILTVAVYFLSDRDLHEKTEQRKKKMQREYPEILHKLVLYLGAGMTLRGAFGKVANDFSEQDKLAHMGKTQRLNRQSVHPAYEEMRYACRELQAGVSEGQVYERFGKRSGAREYIRLGMLLTQNLKKGNGTLLERLEEEASRVYSEQLQNSRKMAEEAMTKLLFPMVMMLTVVMIMIMVPAFSTMGM